MHRLVGSLPPGLLASGPALLALLLGPPLLGGPGVLEVAADGILRAVPLVVFDAVLAALGPVAKGALFLATAGAAVLAGWALGAATLRLLRPLTDGPIAIRAALASGLALALAELVVLPLAGAGLAGIDHEGSAVALQLPLIVASLLYGTTLVLVDPGPRSASAPGPVAAAEPAPARVPELAAPGAPVTRRAVLVGGTALGALAVSGVVAGVRVTTAASASRVPDRRPPAAGGFGPTPALTPVEDHYVVAKGLVSPAVDAATWRLAVDGLVGRPLELSLDEVRALASSAEARTLLCISNPVVEYGPYAGTQVWTGAPVAAAIDAAGGALADARFVHWASADGYTESIPLDVALDPRSLLAWGMGPDGAPLPVEHGFPLRVLLPGRYGMKQPKWLTRITLAAEDLDGYWQQRGWDREAVVRTWSRIDDPRDGDAVAPDTPLPVYGVAFAGERGIRGVEVSPDDGATWLAAEVEPPQAALSWVRWRATLPAPGPGGAALRVRATDGTGALQPETEEPPLPRGAAGWQRVRLIAG